MNEIFYPDIFQYLEETGHQTPISLIRLEDLLAKVRADTGAHPDAIKAILTLFLQEIRTSIIKNQKINIPNLGTFSSSHGTHFRPSDMLAHRINDGRKY